MEVYMSSNKEKILKITSGGVCLALSFILSQVKLFEMPMGGSVTPASCLPVIIFGIAFGPVWGFIVAFLLSLLQLIGGYLLTPFQVFLDYTVGYTALGLLGFASLRAGDREKIANPLIRFRRAGIIKPVLFTVAAYFVRWIGSVLSGVIFCAEYAKDAGYNSALIYAMVYNGSFLLADMGICLAVLVVFHFVIPSGKEKEQTAK